VGQASNFVLRINGPRGSRIYRLPPGETIIGSSPSADVFLPDARVTGAHARITLSGNEILLTDLGSRNGTYLDKARKESETGSAPGAGDPFKLIVPLRYELAPGDRIQVGLTELWLDEDAGPAWRQGAPALAAAAPEPLARPAWYAGVIPPGLSGHSLRLLDFLPEIYRSGAAPGAFPQAAAVELAPVGDFMDRFLALFESVLLPLEWVVDNFDLYLDPRTAPDEFLPWLEDWFGLAFAATLTPARWRNLLCHAHRLFHLKGTRTALIEAIELATGCTAEVDDLTTEGANFIVTIRCSEANPADQALLEELIATFKPIHTTHQLVIAASAQTSH
jgi:phage tail-like protein